VGFDGLENGYAVGVCMMQPFSRGTVRLANARGHPLIDPNCFGDDRDRVADASVIPSVPSTNTAATGYALAERAAR
jgi:GMC oxidoreductase